MAIGTRRIKQSPRYRKERGTIPFEPQLNQEDEEKLAYDEYKKAEKRFEEVVYKNRNKPSIKEEVTPALNDLKRSAGKLANNFFDGAGRISDSVERDIRKHSIQGQIDNTIINALLEKKRNANKPRSKRPAVYIEVPDARGKPTLIKLNDIPAAIRKRRR